MRPWTLVLIGVALTAAGARAFLAPFPPVGGNPYLDLIAHNDPGIHAAIRAWYYLTPGVAVLLAGSIMLSVSRVWLQPLTGRRNRGRLPAWPTSAKDDAPSLVVGELHHPTVATESERPSWLVVPEKGLYTGVLVVGAVGTGKTTACMYPFARQLLTWQADDSKRRAGALVLEVKSDFCHKYRSMIAHTIRCRPVMFRKPCVINAIRRIQSAFTGSLLCRIVQLGIMKYWSVTDTQVGNTTCENDPLRPPSWLA
ncbi:MAG: hypothetical protein F4Z50_16445 [Gemmatimonadetes bacterium]|nr:hypothetical protein [Gemmatimonadota bacterium]MYC90190.1 hypothetical protein [Gemmatimonadota bacterium]